MRNRSRPEDTTSLSHRPTTDAMKQNIVLIDFENVQPESLSLLAQDHFRVMVFVGANQTKIPLDTAASLQRLGPRAEYIQVAGNGPNALDFHIAFYIGRLAATDPTAYFHIVSHDKGFDPLISHFKSLKIFADRVPSIADIPIIRTSGANTPTERIAIIVAKLRQTNATKPKSVKTLSSTIRALLQPQTLSDDEVAAVIEGMTKAKTITLDGTKVCHL